MCFVAQKARLARIQIAKATSGAAFVAKKRAAEARLAAQVTIIATITDNITESITDNITGTITVTITDNITGTITVTKDAPKGSLD